jgi:hypothetical protein
MKHLTEEELVLYYYGEGAEIEEHIGGCDQCRASYQALQRVLNSVDSLPVPERAPDYENRVWAAIEGRIDKRSRWSRWFTWRPALAVAAMAAVVIAAFLAGTRWHQKPVIQQASAVDPNVRERVLLVAVGDHLERSQMILVELANAAPAAGRLDISNEQKTAEDLLESNRLYRQTAATSGDVATAALLEDLERVLLDIAHSPPEVSARQLQELRQQIEDRGILFKVKVFGSRVEQSTQGATQGTTSL